MRAVPLIASGQHGVFTRRQALADGWTLPALRHAVDHGDLERLRPGVFALPQTGSDDRFERAAEQACRAALALGLTHRRATVSHRSAAALHALPLVRAPATPCVTYARPFRGEIRGAHLHRAFLWTGDVVRAEGPALFTSVARTILDVARELGTDDGLALADAALRTGSTTPELLGQVARRCAGWPGMRSAATVLALADPRAESVLESLSRLRITQSGLPAPTPQVVIRAAGRFVGRVDFYWDEVGVVGEADGLAKYDRSSSLREEKRRQEALENAGLIVVRWGWDELYAFDTVAARLRSAFARGRRTDRAPRLWVPTAACHPAPDPIRAREGLG